MAEIRADEANGFANTIPWTWWTQRFTEPQTWRFGVQTRERIIAALTSRGITPVVVLRTYDDQGSPEQRPAASWAPRPPVDADFRNEWWEHCFAIAYWLNVLQGLGVTHFEVLNEPDYSCQGWCNISCPGSGGDFCGTQAEYVQLVDDAFDAISYANGLAGLDTHIHAPVVADHNSSYVSYSLDNADASIQVVDYHTYADDPAPTVISVRDTITSHNPDGIEEPVWVSEWGALWISYDSLNRALLTAEQLISFADEGVEGVTIFNLYDWSTVPGQDYGLIDLQDDGGGGAVRAFTETYFAYRLMTRALVGGKEILAATVNGTAPRVMITRDAKSLFLVVRDGNGTVTVDLSAISGFSGLDIPAVVYEYSDSAKDVIVVRPTVASGHFTFAAPASGLSLAVVPRPSTVVFYDGFESGDTSAWSATLPLLATQWTKP